MLSGGQTLPLRQQMNTRGVPIQLCIQMADFAPTIYKCANNVDHLDYDYSEDFTPIGTTTDGCGVFTVLYWKDDDYGITGLERANVLYGPEEPLPGYDEECPF